MAGYSISRGPNHRQVDTVNLPVDGALLPGTLVTSDGDQLSAAAAATVGPPMVLSNVEFSNQTISTAYVSGDTGIAYMPIPTDMFQVRVAAGTYAYNAPLTYAASGRLAAAGSGDAIVAYCREPGTFSAGDLMDVSIGDRAAQA